ncbi:MAG: cyclic 2,3-diphosphoglycerate synthase [Nitrososphaeria archaeon]
MTRKAIILGAAGRDFHNFNVCFRTNRQYKVVAFTAAQIPYISNRRYPPNASGRRYPKGIPIYDEQRLEELIRDNHVNDVYFSYSDVSHEQVMHLASRTMAAGASFHLLGPRDTMIKSKKTVIAVVATRTGAGKSTISRYVSSIAKCVGKKSVVVRHPMPYGSLNTLVQRFERYHDLEKYDLTVEEREEYEQHIEAGTVVFSGIDYNMILKKAEKEGDIIVWDGGNNDMPFYLPDLSICVADPFRFYDILSSYPGEVNFRSADVIVINKVNASSTEDVRKVEELARILNPKSSVIKTSSEARLDKPDLVEGKKVLVIEDGPTVTHGGLPEAVGAFISRKQGATLVDPRAQATGTIKEAYVNFSHMGPVLPALGYSRQQLRDLEATIKKVSCDAIVLGTPSDLSRIIRIRQPVVRVRFEAKELEGHKLREKLISILERQKQ